MIEKVDSIKETNRLVQVLSNKKTKYIMGTILLSGLGIALPKLFHIFGGANSGATFLPMHIAVLIAALVFGTISSSIVAGGSIVFSYLLTGMPSLARLPYMLIELVIYAVLLSVLNKKFNSCISLILTIVLGRVLYAGALFVATSLLGFSSYGVSVITSVQIGLPGILIQLVCVPLISMVIKKGINLDE